MAGQSNPGQSTGERREVDAAAGEQSHGGPADSRPGSAPAGKEQISTGYAPPAAHTFGQGVRKGGLLQVSGQGAADPVTGRYVGIGDIRAQTRRTLENVRAVLEAGGASMEDVLMFRVYLRAREDFAAMNEAYGEFVAARVPSGVLPSRTTVIVGLPHEDMLIEIDALAVLDGQPANGTSRR